LLRLLAAEIFAFDVLIQNPDRRRESPNGPNLLWSDDEIYLYDHEQAFSFLMGVIGWKPPWMGGGTEFCRNHVFIQQLTGIRHNFDRLSGALEALTDARLKEYVDAFRMNGVQTTMQPAGLPSIFSKPGRTVLLCSG
jgi:hypothetical protein